MSIKDKLYKGAFWNSISQFGSQGINFIIIVILARLLDPKDFGLLGMVTVITSFLGFFTEFGLMASLIKNKDIDELDTNTAYLSSICFSFILFAIVFLCAPLIASFYHEPRLTLITRVVFINFLVAPLAFVPEALEIKKIHYNKITIANLLSLVFSGALGIGCAVSGFGVWSLVVQQISMTLSRGIALIFLTSWRAKLLFSYTRFKKLFGFGAHFAFSNLAVYVSQNIDFLIVGKLLGPVSLGIYSFAFRVSKYPILKFQTIIGGMLFPAFSTFSEDIKRVQRNFIKISIAGGLVLLPLLAMTIFGVDSLVAILVGAKWAGSAPIIRILMICFIFQSISMGDNSILVTLNKIKTVNMLRTISAMALLICGVIVVKFFGAIGMACAFSAVSILYVLITKKILLSEIKLGFRYYLKSLKPIFIYMLFLFSLLGIYSSTCFHIIKSPIGFLIGDGLITLIITILFFTKMKLIDFKNRRILIDNIAPLEKEV